MQKQLNFYNMFAMKLNWNNFENIQKDTYIYGNEEIAINSPVCYPLLFQQGRSSAALFQPSLSKQWIVTGCKQLYLQGFKRICLDQFI